MKKILFFDIDGTLIAQHYGIDCVPNYLKEQLLRLKKMGYGIFIATGRPMAFIPQSILDIGFDGYILCNGAHIVIDGKTFYQQSLDYNLLKDLLDVLEENDIEYDLETEDYCYIDEKYKDIIAFFKQYVTHENTLIYHFNKEDVMKKTLKVELSTTVKQSQFIRSYVDGKFSYDNHGTQSAYELYDANISKSSGIKRVLEYYKISLNNAYAFGDGLNDLEMIQCVGHGIAMGNAVEKLKEVANEVIEHIKDDGLAKYLIMNFPMKEE